MASREVTVSSTTAPFEQVITVGPHRLASDEPAGSGGADAGPDPYELLLAALGSCTSMTLMAYARRKQWPLERVVVQLAHARDYADDCAGCEDAGRRIERIESRISLGGPLAADQKQRLLEIAGKCPVDKTLAARPEIRTSLA